MNPQWCLWKNTFYQHLTRAKIWTKVPKCTEIYKTSSFKMTKWRISAMSHYVTWHRPTRPHLLGWLSFGPAHRNWKACWNDEIRCFIVFYFLSKHAVNMRNMCLNTERFSTRKWPVKYGSEIPTLARVGRTQALPEIEAVTIPSQHLWGPNRSRNTCAINLCSDSQKTATMLQRLWTYSGQFNQMQCVVLMVS